MTTTLRIEIRESACRGCALCVDICPTDVLAMEEPPGAPPVVRVVTVSDCIACLSCAYVCPSGAIEHEGHHVVKNFYRDLDFCRRMERYL